MRTKNFHICVNCSGEAACSDRGPPPLIRTYISVLAWCLKLITSRADPHAIWFQLGDFHDYDLIQIINIHGEYILKITIDLSLGLSVVVQKAGIL